MPQFNEVVQAADWRREKHVPFIEAPDAVAPGSYFRIEVTVGKEIEHPNKTEHHISWIDVFFHPDGEKFSHHVARAEFGAHGASTLGPDTSTLLTHPSTVVSFRTEKPGTLLALSFCNIHGLWQSARRVGIEAPALGPPPSKG